MKRRRYSHVLRTFAIVCCFSLSHGLSIPTPFDRSESSCSPNCVDVSSAGETPAKVSDEAVISEIRVYVDGILAGTTSHYLENVIEPTPTRMPFTEGSLLIHPLSLIHREDGETASRVDEAPAQIKRLEHPADFDWRPNYESVNIDAANPNEYGSSIKDPSTPRTLPFPFHKDGTVDDPVGLAKIRHDQFDTPARRPIIDYGALPPGDRYEIQDLGLTEGAFFFTYLGQFLSLIQPYDFPVEFVRDVLWNKVTVVNLIFQSLRFEAGFVACVTVGLLFSLVIPSFSLASMCSTICLPEKSKMADSASSLSIDSINCSRKTYICLLFLMVAIMGCGVVALLITNEQLSSAMLSSPQALSSTLNDAGTYIRNTHRQIAHVSLAAFDTTLTYLHSDLHEVEELLGKPIQNQVAAETGVDVALDALVDVAVDNGPSHESRKREKLFASLKQLLLERNGDVADLWLLKGIFTHCDGPRFLCLTMSDDLSQKVAVLQDGNLKMRGLMSETRDRLADLRAQVDALRRACPSRDRPLCDTIESTGLEITLRTDQLNADPRLALLRAMSGGDLSVLAKRVRSRFSDIPVDIARATADIRAGIKIELDVQRSLLDVSLWPLENLARDLRSCVNEVRSVADQVEDAVDHIEQWRWLCLLLIAILVLFIWILLALAIIYSCCDKDGAARALLITSLVFSSILSILLWVVAVCIMLVGGHGEVFVCRPLYDQPQYESLTELLDNPGVLLERSGGFFRNLVPRNYTLTVPLKTVLQECQENKPAYQAFRLDSILKVETTSDFKTWENVLNFINNLNGNFTQLNFLDPELQEKLHGLLQATAVNMTSLRSQISRSLTGRDLLSFAKQLDSVANQIKDLNTASRIETLASRTRRLISTNIQPLEEKKEELVYQITALEVLIAPLQRQLNQSLSHLKTIQYYIDNQGSNISHMKAIDYSERLTSYLSQFREQLLSQLHHTVGLCRPVYDLYHGLRHHACRQIMDPLNGYWFALVWCLFALAIVTPVCIKLIHYYGIKSDSLLETSNSLNSSERRVWNSSGNDIPMENSDW